jgi:hypothetical protein
MTERGDTVTGSDYTIEVTHDEIIVSFHEATETAFREAVRMAHLLTEGEGAVRSISRHGVVLLPPATITLRSVFNVSNVELRGTP